MPCTLELQPAVLSPEDARDRTRLGATPVGDGTSFVVVAPHASAVDLCLLQTDGAGAVVSERRVGMHGPQRGAWGAHVSGVGPGQRYAYRVHGEWNPSEGLLANPRKLTLDPYARALEGAPVLGPEIFAHEVDADYNPLYVPFTPSALDSAGHVAVGVVTGPSFPVVPGPKVPQERTVIYETHVKGLTLNMSGVPPELRGTYAGLAHPVTVNYLKNLGVTTIEVLPIHASFSEVFLLTRGRTNYWGYSTLSYFAPEPSYATRAARRAGPQAVLDEVRGMVSILHEAGLEIIMDVVYNHTCESGMSGPSLSLRGLDDLEYYLHAPHRPAQYIDVTGTGNTVDFRSTRAVQLTLDSLRYWAGDVGVDGFRFDLAVTLGRNATEFHPHHPLLVGMATDPLLSGVKLIAEPWDVGPGGWRTGEFPAPFHDWNDRYRGTVRSFWLADVSEMTRGRPGSGVRDLATRLAGSADMFSHGEYPGGRGPLASVNFVTAHDGFTLRDLVSYDHKNNLANGEDNRDGTDDNRSWNHGTDGDVPEGIDAGPLEVLRRRSSRNVLGTLLVSAGTPMLLGGDEMGRSQLLLPGLPDLLVRLGPGALAERPHRHHALPAAPARRAPGHAPGRLRLRPARGRGRDRRPGLVPGRRRAHAGLDVARPGHAGDPDAALGPDAGRRRPARHHQRLPRPGRRGPARRPWQGLAPDLGLDLAGAAAAQLGLRPGAAGEAGPGGALAGDQPRGGAGRAHGRHRLPPGPPRGHHDPGVPDHAHLPVRRAPGARRRARPGPGPRPRAGPVAPAAPALPDGARAGSRRRRPAAPGPRWNRSERPPGECVRPPQ